MNSGAKTPSLCSSPSISGSTLVGTPEPLLEYPTQRESLAPGRFPSRLPDSSPSPHDDERDLLHHQHLSEPTEMELELDHRQPALQSSTKKNILRDIPSGNTNRNRTLLINRADLAIDDRCSKCGDAFPCLTFSCSWRCEYALSPKNSIELGSLRRILSDVYRTEWARIESEEQTLMHRRESIRRIAAGRGETKVDDDAGREMRIRTAPEEYEQQRNRNRLNRLSGATECDAERPAILVFSNSETVKCLHCRTTCSATQEDCPICGGKVRGQCRHPLCNDGTGRPHDPA